MKILRRLKVTTELAHKTLQALLFALGDETGAPFKASDLLEQVEGADEAITVTDVFIPVMEAHLSDNSETWSFG